MGSLTMPAGFNLPHPTTQILEFMMRTLACPLFRWLTVARCQLGPRRQYEAEFPAAIARPVEWTSRSSRAAGRASTDALRLINHQKFIKDKHEILYIREKFAPRARAFPPPRRWPGASIFRRQSGATEERVLVTNRGFFRSARQRRSQNSTTQRIAIAPSGAHPTYTGTGRSYYAAALRRRSVIRCDGERLV